MNCQIFETVVNDLARDQIMEANAREDALAHSRVCKECALRLSLERRLTFGLRALAAEMMSVSASARVEGELLEDFRSHTPLPKARPAERNGHWLAAAAVVLIAFGVAGVKWGLLGPSQSIERNIGTGDSPDAVAFAPEQKKVAGSGETQSYRRRRKPSYRSLGKRTSGRNETTVAQGRTGRTNTGEILNSDQSEVTSQFLPLSYASPVSLQDGGQLVRVEMSRAAMVSFGLPVNMERYGEKVKADVLVSADGLARAIRFVQ